MKGILYERALSYGRQLWRHKWLAISTAWVICAVGWAVVALLPPQYESSARVYLDADQLLTPLLHGVAADVDPNRQVEYLVRTLLSRPNLEEIIHMSDLDIASHTGDTASDREQLLQQLAKEVTVTPQTINLMTINYRNPDPVVAKNVVQALVTVFAENSAGSNRKEMENARRFLDQQIETYADQLRAAEKRNAEFHEKYIDLLPSNNKSGENNALSRLDVVRNTVKTLELSIADARAKRDSLQQQLASVPQFLAVDAAAATQVIVSGRASSPADALQQARARLQQMKAEYTDEFPDVIALRRQIAVLEAQAGMGPGGAVDGRKTQVENPVYDKIKEELVDAETTIASLGRRLQEAEAERAKLEEEARQTPGVQAQAEDISRDYDAKKKSFDELLQRREETRVAEAADTTADKIQFRIIDPPQVPVIPVAPSQPILLSAVFLLAVVGAVAVPLILIQFDRSFATVSALRALGLPVLGSVSWLAFPDARRRERLQIAALCASAIVLCAIYSVLLMISINLYGLEFV